jgi:hypothetical protein
LALWSAKGQREDPTPAIHTTWTLEFILSLCCHFNGCSQNLESFPGITNKHEIPGITSVPCLKMLPIFGLQHLNTLQPLIVSNYFCLFYSVCMSYVFWERTTGIPPGSLVTLHPSELQSGKYHSSQWDTGRLEWNAWGTVETGADFLPITTKHTHSTSSYHSYWGDF